MSEPRLRVLWLSNATLKPLDDGTTGTWLHAMADGLVDTGRIILGNVTTGAVPSLTRADTRGITQWIAPSARQVGRDGLPKPEVVSGYLAAIEEFKPDLIHVWGAETFPGLLTARGLVTHPALLEIQGLKGPLCDLYQGGLTFTEQLKCIGLKEIVRRSTIHQERAFFRRWNVFEREIMEKHRFITTPSPWMEAHALAANPNARLFQNELLLRKEFLACEPWKFTGAPVVFCSAAYPQPFKGLHTLIRAAKILRHHFPALEIRIAGAHKARGLRLSGYVRWLSGEIRKAGVESSVHWLGSIDAKRLCEELSRSSVAVFPSFAESYGVALAEAMIVGTPAVCAFNGGSGYLAGDGKSALFFPAGDHVVCANEVKRLLENRPLAESLSNNARSIALRRHDPSVIVERQLSIYDQFMRESRSASGAA